MKTVLRILLIALLFYQGKPMYAQTIEHGLLILQEYNELPAGAKKKGEIRVLDNGYKIGKCSYGLTIEEACTKARKKGGNVIKIRTLKKPDVTSTCYRLWAEVYEMDNVEEYAHKHKPPKTAQELAIDSALALLIPDTASYALLLVYRQRNYAGSLIRYNLHAEDTVICRVKNGSKHVVKLYNIGMTKIWARTEGADEVEVDVRPGKVFFLRCGVSMGAFVGHPALEIVSAYEGLPEYNALEYEPDEPMGDDIYR